MLYIPNEIYHHIMINCDLYTLFKLSLVCSNFYILVKYIFATFKIPICLTIEISQDSEIPMSWFTLGGCPLIPYVSKNIVCDTTITYVYYESTIKYYIDNIYHKPIHLYGYELFYGPHKILLPCTFETKYEMNPYEPCITHERICYFPSYMKLSDFFNITVLILSNDDNIDQSHSCFKCKNKIIYPKNTNFYHENIKIPIKVFCSYKCIIY